MLQRKVLTAFARVDAMNAVNSLHNMTVIAV